MNKLCIVISDKYSPYENLAKEWSILNNCKSDTVYFYLWQNSPTIVIGANQNPFTECNVPKIKEDNVFLARRKSGGGAVYHDNNNLNFSFIADKSLFDVDKQLNVIINTLGKFGVTAEKTGRNDIYVDGKKFSGNAFFHTKNASLHHGTILVDVDMTNMAKYLTFPKEKLSTKGVKSTSAKVVNLKTIIPTLTIKDLIKCLESAFLDTYSGDMITLTDELKDIDKVTRLFSSDDYIFANWENFSVVASGAFDWGVVKLSCVYVSDKIVDISLNTDSLDTELMEKLKKAVLNCEKPYHSDDSQVRDIISLL